MTEPQWRVEVNNFPGYEIKDVTLTFNYVGGALTYSFTDILGGKFVDTPPFDPTLEVTTLTLQYTWPHKTLKIGPYDTFIADSLMNSTTGPFPPPLFVNLKGIDIHVVPEPASVMLIGTGMAGLLGVMRLRKGIK